jgi:hypothetical protein
MGLPAIKPCLGNNVEAVFFDNILKWTHDTLAVARYADCQTSMTKLGSNIEFSQVVSRSAGCGP